MDKYFYIKLSLIEHDKYRLVKSDDRHIWGVGDSRETKMFKRGCSWLIFDPDAYLKNLYNDISECYRLGFSKLTMPDGISDIKALFDKHKEASDKIKEYIALSAQVKKDKEPDIRYVRLGNELIKCPHPEMLESMFLESIAWKDDKYVDEFLDRLRDEQFARIKGIFVQDTNRGRIKDELEFYMSIEKAIKELEDE
jgi:hypothetical protein